MGLVKPDQFYQNNQICALPGIILCGCDFRSYTLKRELEDVYESQMLLIQSELLSGSICILCSQTIYSLLTK